MIPESKLEPTEHGLVPKGEGWFVVNAREARWRHAEGRTAVCWFEGEPDFPQLGINLTVLAPGEPMAMYHWEADQEDFLVLSGEALLIVEGQERALRQWDFVHCPAGAKHVIVGAGEGPASCSQSARATARSVRSGADIPSIHWRPGMERVSRWRRPSPRRRTPVSPRAG